MTKVLAFALIALVLLAAGCGSRPAATLRQGTIEVRRDVSSRSLLKGVMGIKRGSTDDAVRDKFGTPFAKVPYATAGSPRETCWAYHAHQDGTSLDALDFCVRAGLVQRVLIGVHL